VGPPTVLGNFDRAIAEKRLDAAWANAIRVPHLSLDRALRLTILMAEEESPGFEPAARRFLARFMKEHKPSLGLVCMVVEALRRLEHPTLCFQARDQLEELAKRMAEQDLDAWRPGRHF
jgi:hypothetical protein